MTPEEQRQFAQLAMGDGMMPGGMVSPQQVQDFTTPAAPAAPVGHLFANDASGQPVALPAGVLSRETLQGLNAYQQLPAAPTDAPAVEFDATHAPEAEPGHAAEPQASGEAAPMTGADYAMATLNQGHAANQGDEANVRGAYNALRQANNATVLAEQAANKQRAADLEKQSNEIAASASAQGKIATAQADYMRQSEGQLTDMMGQLQADKIDPERLWNSKSTGSKITARLATFLCGIGQALQGDHGPNKVVGMLMADTDRDIAAQKDNHDTLRSAIGLKQNIVGMARQRFTDESQANSAQSLARIQVLKMQAEQMALQSNDPLVKARNDQLQGQLRLAEAKELTALHNTSNQLGLQRATLLINRDTAMAKVQAKQAASQAAQVTLPGYSAPPTNSKQRTLVGNEIGEYRNVAANLADVTNYVKQHGGVSGKLAGPQLREANAKIDILRAGLVSRFGITPEKAKELAPDADAMGYNLARLSALRQTNDRRHEALLSGFGMRKLNEKETREQLQLSNQLGPHAGAMAAADDEPEAEAEH